MVTVLATLVLKTNWWNVLISWKKRYLGVLEEKDLLAMSCYLVTFHLRPVTVSPTTLKKRLTDFVSNSC